ncbi:uncharacterized protein LOC125015041 [Mugil cephalus]|uniref:uncharacterized protein LOC125015041 n=1 Tax=Mugil cephalus TaxID=48193 RepID=UPI001FB7D7F3|nr:uncharacterized protein LOC125015041 [Mugil cephalus]
MLRGIFGRSNWFVFWHLSRSLPKVCEDTAAAVMAAGFLIRRILLICLFSEVNYSLAFPRGRSFLHPRVWQGKGEEPHDLSEHGTSRPIQYIQAPSVSPRSRQPNVQDQVNDKWQNPQGSLNGVPSRVRIKSRPILYRQKLSPDEPSSDAGFRRPQEISSPQRNNLPLQPRNFEFSVKIPVSNILSIIKDTSLTSPSDSSVHLNKGLSKDGRTDFSSSVPNYPSQSPSSSNVGYSTNLQIPQSAGFVQNNYMEQANPQSSSTQITTEWTNLNHAGTVQQQTQHQASEQVQSKPTNNKPVAFSLGQSSQQMNPIEQMDPVNLPTPQSLEFPNPGVPNDPQYPSSSSVGHLTNLQIPQSTGSVQNSHMEPANPQSSSTQTGIEWTSSNTAGHVQQQTQQVHSKPTNTFPDAFSPGQSSQQMNPTDQTGHINFPAPQNLMFPKPSVPNDPQYVDPYSGYTSPQINRTRDEDQTNVQLTLSPPQYEPIPSDIHSGNNYAQTWQPVHTPQYNCPQYTPPCDCSQKETAPHASSTPSVDPSQYEHPTFYNREVASSASHETLNAAAVGQNRNPSFSPHQHSSDSQGTSQHFQPQSTDRQTQMRLAGQNAERQSGRPRYIKLYIDVDEGADGENKYFTEQTAEHDYFGRTMARRPNKNPNIPFSKLQSRVSVRQDHLTDLLDSTYPHKKILRHYLPANPLHV